MADCSAKLRYQCYALGFDDTAGANLDDNDILHIIQLIRGRLI